MTFSPGDIVIYEAPLAGRDNTNQTKAAGSTGRTPTVVVSPPLLGTRLSPRRPVESPMAEYAPMRTPSPSLMGPTNITPEITLLVPAPAVPTLTTPTTPMEYGNIPASTAVSEGLNLLALDDEEDINEQEGMDVVQYAVGLGIGLGLEVPGYDSEDLITVMPNIFTPEGDGLGVGLDGWDSERIIASPDLPPIYDSPINFGAGLGLGLDGFDPESLIVDEMDQFDEIDLSEALDSDSPTPAFYDVLMSWSRGMGAQLSAAAAAAQSSRGSNINRTQRPSLVRNSIPSAPAPHSPSIDDENLSTPPSASSLPRPIFSPTLIDRLDLPTRSTTRSLFSSLNFGLGLVSDGGDPLVLQSASTIESPVSRRAFPVIYEGDNEEIDDESPMSGSDSPFWGTYAEEARAEGEQARRRVARLLSRLPVIEERE